MWFWLWRIPNESLEEPKEKEMNQARVTVSRNDFKSSIVSFQLEPGGPAEAETLQRHPRETQVFKLSLITPQ